VQRAQPGDGDEPEIGVEGKDRYALDRLQERRDVAELARLLETRLLEGAYPWLNSVVIQGPFLNLKLEMGVFGTEVIDQVLKMGGDYGEENIGKGKIVAIDMSSPNIAKRMSYGHLRSTIIGDALANLYKAQGYEPIRDNHLGDWGTQFGNLIVAIKKWGNEPELMESSDPIGVLQDLYVKFHTRMEAEKDAHKISIKKVLIEEGAAAIPGLSEAIRRRTQDLIKKKKVGHTNELTLSEEFYDYFNVQEKDKSINNLDNKEDIVGEEDKSISNESPFDVQDSEED